MPSVKSAEERLAIRFAIDFGARVRSSKLPYFKERGFTYQNVVHPDVLFRFLAILSYDMRPYFSYEDAWGPDDPSKSKKDSVMVIFDREGVNLDFVESASEPDLRLKLKGQRVHGLSLEKIGSVDHAKGLKELAMRTRRMVQLLETLDQPNHVIELRHTIDDVHGFGKTLSAKAIMFLVRCFGIGLTYIDPKELEEIAWGLSDELWIERRRTVLSKQGIDPARLINELTKAGDPLAIELLYELEDAELETILKNEGAPTAGR